MKVQDETIDPLTYYTRHGLITDPAEHVGWFDDRPRALPELVQLVQGVMLHVFWAKSYGVTLTPDREAEAGYRRVARMLPRLRELDGRPLSVPRAPEHRLVGNCRSFSVLLASLLRRQGVPARARCGFGAYLRPGQYEDHWVGEYWNVEERRWALVDAQLDQLQCDALGVAFDPLDVPREQFLVGGAAWALCRGGSVDPERFGIFDMHGRWFVRGNLVRDVAALNKVELLPWDGWGLIDRRDQELTPDDLELLDRAAALTAGETVPLAEVQALYVDERLRVPPVIRSYTSAGPLVVEVATEKVLPGLETNPVETVREP